MKDDTMEFSKFILLPSSLLFSRARSTPTLDDGALTMLHKQLKASLVFYGALVVGVALIGGCLA